MTETRLDVAYRATKDLVRHLRESNEALPPAHTVTDTEYDRLELEEMAVFCRIALGRPRIGVRSGVEPTHKG